MGGDAPQRPRQVEIGSLVGAPRITESRIAISAVHGEDGITFPDTGEKLTDSQRVVEGLYDYPEGNTFYALNFL